VGVVEQQMLLAVAASTALLAGAARDDRAYEWHRANFDELTGLANRNLFADQLEREMARARRAGGSLALMYVDLDHFKQVNDSLGHHAGDLLLQQMAERLQACTRETDLVARLGGDEFAVIVGDMAKPGSEERIGTDILRSLGEPFVLDGQTVNMAASIGVAYYPVDAQSPFELQRQADHALYDAKRQGRARMVSRGGQPGGNGLAGAQQ
jgi:diguanylate cyclase (GGDEF)-like protein